MEKKEIIYSDESSFEKVLTNYFPKLQPYLRLKLYNIKVKFIEYSNGTALFEFPYLDNFDSEHENEINVFIKNKTGDEFSCFFKLIEKKEENILMLKPEKIYFYKIQRIEERINLLNQVENNEYIYISDIISDFLIKEYLADNLARIDKIKEEISSKLVKKFDHIKVYFSNEKMSDRFNHFLDNIVPIYIQNIKDNSKETDNSYAFYKNNIYKNDRFLNENNYISEISIPLMHRMKLPYGYVQVNSRSPIANTLLREMKKFAGTIDQLVNKYNIIPTFYEKITVSDISKTGISVLFKERKYIKYFKEKSLVCFDLFLPGSVKVNILAKVQNILFSNINIKIGFKFKEIDALSQVYYDEFFEKFQK